MRNFQSENPKKKGTSRRDTSKEKTQVFDAVKTNRYEIKTKNNHVKKKKRLTGYRQKNNTSTRKADRKMHKRRKKT